MATTPISVRSVRRFVDRICEFTDPAAGGDPKNAVVKVEVTGNPKTVQRAIQQLARSGGKPRTPPKPKEEPPPPTPAPRKPKPDLDKEMESLVDDLLDG